MYDELVAWLRSWSELLTHCECYESCGECDKQDLCSTFTFKSIITKAGETADAIEELVATVGTAYNELANNEANKPRWIPVTERVPDDRRDVQITVFWHDAWRTMCGYYDGAFWQANRVLDEYEYNGKTIREWADLIANPKTNADRIRAMTDEELAAWLSHHSMACVQGKRPCPEDCVGGCEQCWLDWLKQEAGE